jgi:hypothetical protein
MARNAQMWKNNESNTKTILPAIEEKKKTV